MEGFSYIPGDEPERKPPFGRYLPLIPEGVASAFLSQHARQDGEIKGTWILDPFGASPALAVEMARRNYRVLVAVNNPVTRFLFEMASRPPSRAELRSALADLASARRGEERLETHLQSLYLTECTRCQQMVPAEAFIWDKATNQLTGRIYRCQCGENGEYPVTEADKKRAAALAATDGLHRSRAIERVASRDDPDRQNTEEVLQYYLPRAVYALITIINKLDSLTLPPERRRALLALLLSACDECSSLWPHPGDRPRPKQLSIPPHFLERNVWLALEKGIEQWADDGTPVQCVNWPAVPVEQGGLSLFEGPVRDLAPQLKDLALGAVVTAFPRPNQAYWTLSALWAGWLWGHEAVASFKSVVRRRRYDWNWHGGALHAALKNLAEHLPLNTPLFAMLTEPEPQFLSTAVLAAAAAGLDLAGLALRTRHDPVQALWHRRAFTRDRPEPKEVNHDIVLEAVQDGLRERGEPATYLFVHSAGLTALAFDHSLQWGEEALTLAQSPILTALSLPDFIHYSGSTGLESGLWGLVSRESNEEPLPDRVEVELVRLLQRENTCSMRAIENALNALFPGLLTPSWGLLNAILFSYAINEGNSWSLRLEDSASSRRADLEAADSALALVGSRLGYTLVREEKPFRRILWQEDGKTRYVFYLLASAVIGRLLRQENIFHQAANFIVLPGGRAGLLAYKLGRDPSLAALGREWHIVKFRHLRRLAEMTNITRLAFEKNLSADPIEPPEQMKLF